MCSMFPLAISVLLSSNICLVMRNCAWTTYEGSQSMICRRHCILRSLPRSLACPSDLRGEQAAVAHVRTRHVLHRSIQRESLLLANWIFLKLGYYRNPGFRRVSHPKRGDARGSRRPGGEFRVARRQFSCSFILWLFIEMLFDSIEKSVPLHRSYLFSRFSVQYMSRMQ